MLLKFKFKPPPTHCSTCVYLLFIIAPSCSHTSYTSHSLSLSRPRLQLRLCQQQMNKQTRWRANRQQLDAREGDVKMFTWAIFTLCTVSVCAILYYPLWCPLRCTHTFAYWTRNAFEITLRFEMILCFVFFFPFSLCSSRVPFGKAQHSGVLPVFSCRPPPHSLPPPIPTYYWFSYYWELFIVKPSSIQRNSRHPTLQ